jgi:hypothetical protein
VIVVPPRRRKTSIAFPAVLGALKDTVAEVLPVELAPGALRTSTGTAPLSATVAPLPLVAGLMAPEIAKVGATPVPDRLIVCGLPAALSMIVTAPVWVPVAVGENVTLIAQEPLTGIELIVQLLFCPNGTLAAIVVTVSGKVPVLVTVTVWGELGVLIAWFAKARLADDRLTTGAGAKPVPVKPICCGLPMALSLIVTVPVMVPPAVGENVMLIVQLAAAASVDGLMGQLFVCEYCELATMPLMESGVVAELLNVTVCATLDVPTA